MQSKKKDFKFREIPYNYTSFSDKEIILNYFDEETWGILTELRSRRVTGRSAKLLFEIIGDIFIIDRNPYIYNDFFDNKKKRQRLHKLHQLRLDVIEKGGDDALVDKMMQKTREVVENFFNDFDFAREQRAKVRSTLRAITDNVNIKFTAFHKAAHITDATDWRVICPLVVVYPEKVEEVPLLIQAAKDLGLKVIPRGGGTGLTGGAIPVEKNTMIINTEKLNVIHGITEVNDNGSRFPVISLEAGVITEHAMEHSQDSGLIFATDPTSSWASTIGGNIAENCGGKKAVMWGTAIDNIYSFTLYNASGEKIKVKRNSHPYRKISPTDKVIFDVLKVHGNVQEKINSVELSGTEIRKEGVGKDITNKVLGGVPGIQKEGGDGVIVEAEFVLYKPFSYCQTVCLEFFGKDLLNASKAIIEIRDRFENDESVYLTALEHFDEKYEEAINYKTKSEREVLPKAVLLIDAESDDEQILEKASSQILKIVSKYNTEGFVARTEKEQEAFWQDRKNLGAIAKHTNAFKLNEDVVIPIESLPVFADFIELLNIYKDLKNSLDIIAELCAYMATKVINDDQFISGKKISYTSSIGDIKSEIDKNLLVLSNLLKMIEVKDFEGYIASKSGFDEIRDSDIVEQINEKLENSYKKVFQGYEQLKSDFAEIISERRSKRIIIATHMHAGDGNIHVNIPVMSNDYLMMQEADYAASVVMIMTTLLGGVISGEHGIGLTKLKFIDQKVLDSYKDYKNEVDPDDLFNPGKLSNNFPTNRIYTPSLNLIEAEAFILKSSDLESLTSSISGCVRCGKCKPVCNTHYPKGIMLFSPRNKIMALSMIEEAVLYEAQTESTMSLRNFAMMRNVSSHCTGCHNCFPPCPVDIDFGDVTLQINKLLVERNRAKFNPMTWFTLFYLKQKGYYTNKIFRLGLLKIGFRMQRLGFYLNKPVQKFTKSFIPWVNNLLVGRFPKSGDKSIREILNLKDSSMFYSFRDPNKEVKRSVVYFPGCGSERMYPDISIATISLLNHAGIRVVIPPEFLCCGFTLLANGRVSRSERVSHENQVVFHRMADTISYMEVEDVVVSCGTCHEMLDMYQLENIFQNSSVIDIAEFIAKHKLYSTKSSVDLPLYHEPCHSPMKKFPLEETFESLLQVSPEIVPNCCGESGTLALSRPDISNRIRDRKENNIKDTLTQDNENKSCGNSSGGSCGSSYGSSCGSKENGEEVVLTSCPNCVQGLSKIQNSVSVKGKHLAVYLAEEIFGQNWKKDFIKKVKKDKHLEKIIF